MNARAAFVSVVVVALLLALTGAVPAQSKRVIKISLSSWKFEPNILTFNEGDTVVLQLANIDTQRPHNISSKYFDSVNFTVRGDAAQGTAPDGRERLQLEPGKTAEIEFVATGRGQVSFICTVFDHATRGMTGAMIIWPPGYHTGQ